MRERLCSRQAKCTIFVGLARFSCYGAPGFQEHLIEHLNPFDEVTCMTYLASEQSTHAQRLVRFGVVVALSFCALFTRLAYLQTARFEELSAVASANYTKHERLFGERGAIYDREGRVLAENRVAFDLLITPREVREPEPLIEGITPLLKLDRLGQLELRELLNSSDRSARNHPTMIARDLQHTQVSALEDLNVKVGGLSIQVKQQRTYPEGEIGAHVVGYLGRPTLKELKSRDLAPSEMVGRFGVERLYDNLLRGEHGYRRFVVNARGQAQHEGWAKEASDEISTLKAPSAGQDIYLTIDSRAQRLAYEALEGYESGAIVVMDPRTGALLASVSKPGFDPNMWSGRLTADAKRAIDENPYHPMLDKSVKSYFPGSIYKVVTALAAMEEGILDPEQPIDSPGAYEYGNRVFHCHKRSGHGHVDLNGAMAASADVYFYKLGEKMGIDTLAVYGRQFGFGEPLLKINGESAGVVPTRAYHEEHSRGGFQHGLSLSSAIGQGAVRTSPLQMAVAFSALANHGVVYRPQLLLKSAKLKMSLMEGPPTDDQAAQLLERYHPEVIRRLPASAAHIQRVRRSLERAVNDPKRATGYRGAASMGRVAGKTGTAQVKTIVRGYRRLAEQRWEHRDHAWFASFAPYESPKLTVVVFLEHGGSGGKDAAPIARKVIEGFHQEVEPIFESHARLELFSGARR